MDKIRIAILGAGNIGTAIAHGLVKSGLFTAGNIILTRRRVHLLEGFREQGFILGDNNPEAVMKSDVVIVCVEPQQIDGVLTEIAPVLDPARHILVSVVTGVSIRQISMLAGEVVSILRVMPNTAIAVGESMTCIAVDRADGRAIETTRSIFDTVGKTLVIAEEEMNAATALGACGVAFFLRAIRAASQGGIEIGFHSADALAIAAQTARGAASLLLAKEKHPEHEIDRVTTPRGCTIAGLNQMEHEGFSSAMIKGITVSAERASKLYTQDQTNN